THPERRVARSVQVLREGLVDDGALGDAEPGAVTGKTLADFASDVRLDSLSTAAPRHMHSSSRPLTTKACVRAVVFWGTRHGSAGFLSARELPYVDGVRRFPSPRTIGRKRAGLRSIFWRALNAEPRTAR